MFCRNSRRLLAALCLLLLAALHLSCAAPGGDHKEGVDAVDPAGQKIAFWYTHTGTREAALLDLFDLYNQTNPHGITVRGHHMGGHNQLYHEMLLGIEGGPLPQIVEAYQNQIRTYHKAGVIVDLSPYMASPLWGLSEAARADYIPDFLQLDNINGVQTALLPNRSMEVLYYNRDWLEQLGYEAPPADWTQFEAMCRAAAKMPFPGTTGGRGIGIAYERDASRLASIIFSLGGDVMNPAQTAYTYQTPECRRALQMIRALVSDGAAALVANDADREAFIAGRTLFAQRSSAGAPQIAAAIDEGLGFAWGVAGLPTDQPSPVENVYGASLAVVRSSPQQELASWLFLRWFTEPEQQDRWASASGYFPVRRSIAQRLGSYFRVAYNLLQYGKPEPSVAGYEPVRALVVETMVEVAEHGADIDASLAALESQANDALESHQK